EPKGKDMSLRRRLLSRIRSRFEGEPVPLRLVFWDGEVFDLAAEPTVTLTIKSRSVLRSLAAGRIGKLGDAYAAGGITAEGDPFDIVDVGIRLSERLGKLSGLATFARPLSAVLSFRHTK